VFRKPLRRVAVVAITTMAVCIALAPPAIASVQNGQIAAAEVMQRAQNWFSRNYTDPMLYNASRAPSTYHSDPEGSHLYAPDCSAFVSMTLHLTSSNGGLNTSGLAKPEWEINKANLQPGDYLVVLTTIGTVQHHHAILFEGWQPDHIRFSYWSFGSNYVHHHDGSSATNHGSYGSIDANATIDSHPSWAYKAYHYPNMTGGGLLGGGYANGTVLREPSGAIGVVAGGALFSFATMAEITEAGYGSTPYVSVPAGTFSTMSRVPVNGTLVRRPNGWLAVTAGGARFGFQTMQEISEAGYGGQAFTNVPTSAFDALPTSPADGTLIRRPNGWLGVTAGGARFGFQTMQEVTEAGFGGQSFVNVPTTAFDALPTSPADGTLIRRPNGWIAVTAGGARFGFQTMQEVTDAGYEGQQFAAVPTTAFDVLTTVARDGTLVRAPSDPNVWRVTNGSRAIATPGPGEIVTSIPASALAAIPVT
jgi:hypothetical protein